MIARRSLGLAQPVGNPIPVVVIDRYILKGHKAGDRIGYLGRSDSLVTCPHPLLQHDGCAAQRLVASVLFGQVVAAFNRLDCAQVFVVVNRDAADGNLFSGGSHHDRAVVNLGAGLIVV